MKGAVTGVFSYSGRLIAEALLARGWEVVALGRRRPSPAESLAGRVDFSPLLLDHEEALVSADSPFPYFRGKAAVEDALRRADCSYAILRPTLIFGGREEVLVNNIAWLLRRLPLFLLPDGGRCRLQPVSVFDLARIAADLGETDGNVVLDLAGPETFTFADFVVQIKDAVGSHARLLSAPSGFVSTCSALAGSFFATGYSRATNWARSPTTSSPARRQQPRVASATGSRRTPSGLAATTRTSCRATGIPAFPTLKHTAQRPKSDRLLHRRS